MSFKVVHLRKLLTVFYAPDNLRVKMLRDDIRSQMHKEAGGSSSTGGDFYGPFWRDAKDHVLGAVDLRERTKARIAADGKRARLYPELTNGFLRWWEDKRRWRNEPIEPMPPPANTRVAVTELGCTIKVESVLALGSGPDFHRLIYPYFSEKPALPDEGTRLALWALTEALGSIYGVQDMRVLDVIRANSQGAADVPLQGDERTVLVRRYRAALDDWDKLRREY